MKSLLITLTCIASTLTFGQKNYEQEMKQGFVAWNEGNADDSKAFAIISKEFPKEFLPKYYTALISTLAAFDGTDEFKKQVFIDASENNILELLKEYPANAEVLNFKALNITAQIVFME